MKAIAVIPARLESTRLPRKVLADIHGNPMLWHVWTRTKKATKLDDVIVATDSSEVLSLVKSWGGNSMLTSKDCQSGTERIASLASQLDADYVINVQGDEPLVSYLMIDNLVQYCFETHCDLATAVFQLKSHEDLINPNIVKVVRAENNRAIYFSRSPIPFSRDHSPENWINHNEYYGHIGIYAYRREILDRYVELPHTKLENIEKLEQLRFLDAGIEIQTIVTDYHPIAVDVHEDIEFVRKIISQGDKYDYQP